MACCTSCGMETSGETVCGFCRIGPPHASTQVNTITLRDLVDAVVHRGYAENMRQPTPQPEQPGNITVPQAQIPDIVRLNKWMNEILVVAYGHRPPGDKLYVLRSFAADAIKDVTLLLESKKRDDFRALPVIVDREWTDRYWKVLELVEHIYGRYVERWFDSKPRSEWKRERMFLYINLWHLGNLYRHGKPALSTSAWLTGERKPISGDPFGNVPIGQER